jgi:serine/threonine protein kinase
MPFAIGEYIGPYKLVEETGQGGMASVYKAYHQSLDRYVAIKAIQLAFVQDKDFLARFQREAKVVARLEHPNIVPIYDYSQFEGRPYIVMKFIEGESLKDRLNRQHLSSNEILEILNAVGLALDYAHKNNVLHRDIKPANVLLGYDGHIYLADFGLARLALGGEVSITGDRMIGTPHYMSPEQGLGLAKLDNRTDIYSLGVMLYEMVVGRVPFDADTPFTIIHNHIYTPPPPPRTFNINVPPAIEAILTKALAKDPNDRFPDVGSLVTAFRAFVNNTPLANLPGSNDHERSFSQSVTDPEAILVPDLALPKWANQSINHGRTQVIGEKESSQPEITVKRNKVKPVMVNESPKSKNNSKTWLFIMAGIFIIALLSGVFFFSFYFPNIQNGTKLTQTSDQQIQLQSTIAVQVKNLQATSSMQPRNIPKGTSLPIQEVDANTDTVIQIIDEAARLWNNENTEEAKQMLQKAESISSLNTAAFYDLAIKELGKNNAWGLAAYVLYTGERTQPVENVYKQVEKIHEVVYKAAKDPRSGNLFLQYPNNPLLMVASIRYELYFGDISQAKDRLEKISNNPLQNKRFPEARLLMIEYNIQIKDIPSAQNLLKKLLQDSPNLPKWVLDEANQLESIINPS